MLHFGLETAQEYICEWVDIANPDAVKRTFAAAALAAASCTPATAITLEGALTQGGTVVADFSGSTANIRFSALEFLDVEIGNALGTTAGASDWTLGGLAAGDRFTLTVSAVPEPGSLAMLLAGVAVLGALRQRRG